MPTATVTVNLVDKVSARMQTMANRVSSSIESMSQHFEKLADAGSKQMLMGTILQQTANEMINQGGAAAKLGTALDKQSDSLVKAGFEQFKFGDAVATNLKHSRMYNMALDRERQTMIGAYKITDDAANATERLGRAMAKSSVNVGAFISAGEGFEGISRGLEKMVKEGLRLETVAHVASTTAMQMESLGEISKEQAMDMKKGAAAAEKTASAYQKLGTNMIAAMKHVDMFKEAKKKEKKVVDRNAKSTKELSKRMQTLGKAIRGAGSRLRALSRAMIWTGRDISVLGGVIIGFAGLTIKKYGEVQTAIVDMALALRFQGAEILGIQDAIDGLTLSAMNLGQAYGFSAQQAFDSSKIMIMTGLDAAGAAALQEKAMQLARGTGLDLSVATETLITTMNLYGLTLEEASELADMLTMAHFNTISSVNEVAKGMTYAAGTANRWGVNIEDLIAAMTIMDRQGISMSLSGRSLAATFDSLGAKAGDMGVEVFDASGSMLPLTTILENLRRRMAYYNTEQERGAFLAAWLGINEAKAIQALLNHQDELDELSEAYRNSAGAAETASGQQLKTLQGRLGQLGAAVNNLMIIMGEELYKVLDDTGVWEQLQSFLLDIQDDVRMLAKAFGEQLAEGIRSAIKWIEGAIEWYKKNKELAHDLAGGLAKVALVAITLGPILMGLGILMEPVALSMSIMGSAINTAGLAMGFFKGTAIGAELATQGVAAVASTFAAALVFLDLAAGIAVGTVEGLTEEVGEAKDETEGAGEETDNWTRLLEGLGGIIGGIVAVVFEFGHAIGFVLGQIGSFILDWKMFEGVGGEVVTLFDLIVGVVEGFAWILDIAVKGWQGLIDAFKAFGIIETIIKILQGFWDLIVGIVQGIWDLIDGIIGGSPGLIPAFQSLMDIIPGVSGAFNMLGSAFDSFGSVVGGVTEGLDEFVGGVQSAIDKALKGDLIGAAQDVTEGAIKGTQSIADGVIGAAHGAIDATAGVMQDLACGIFGCSPGVIPGLEEVQSLIDGIARGMPRLSIGGIIGEAMGGGVGAASPMGGGPMTVNIYVSGGENAEETGKIIGEAFIAEIRGEQRRLQGGPY